MNFEDRVTKEYLENAIAGAAPKFEFGSYIGTGEYGAEHPTTITFGFEPKIVFINSREYSDGGFCNFFIRGANQASTISNSGAEYKATFHYQCVSWEGNTLSFYTGNNVRAQANVENRTYYYLAIG